MSSSPKKARAVDHLLLPVADLGVAIERYQALGFTLAPIAQHPFGTENACIYFADGTFLEPLAIHQREDCERTAKKGNIFTARDQAYRFRRKTGEGFSAVAMKTDNADADHKHFVKEGISAGRKLRFKRWAEDEKSNRSKAAFKLAFAADLRSPDSFFFTCEVEAAPKIDRSSQMVHENGAVSLKEIAMSESNPTDFQYILQEVANQRLVDAHSFGMEIQSANANMAVYSPDGIKAWYGLTGCSHGRGLRLRAFSLGVKDLAATEKLLAKAGIEAKKIAHRLVVPPAPGQGAAIAFEQD